MAQSSPSLVGAILERKHISKPSASLPRAPSATENGFPAVQHRSKSAFARVREQSQKRPINLPVIQNTSPQHAPPQDINHADDWRPQVEEDNLRHVEAMTDEERERERDEILQRFGPNIADVLRRARKARERGVGSQQVGPASSASASPSRSRIDLEKDGTELRDESPTLARLDERARIFTSMMGSSCSPPTSASSTRPPSRADRRIRFADITPNDIHVYESAPPSPRRKAIALPSPSDADGHTTPLGQWKPPALLRSNVPTQPSDATQEETFEKVGIFDEGTPEDIRRRFFPTAPANASSLEWIQNEPAPELDTDSTTTLRFDLNGKIIPAQLSVSLPTHLGLHHHAEGSHAGYTIEDIFLLSRSTVPGQRATMLGVLSRIAHKLSMTSRDKNKGIPELAGQELALRKRMLAAGAEAMAERASVGARAVELLWECTTRWDEEVEDVEGVELTDLDLGEALSSLPLEYLLPQIANSLAVADLPRQSLSQLLGILHRLAQHSNSSATAIVATKGLVANILQTFLLTPIPPTSGSPLPGLAALRFLRTLAISSRENATALIDPTDSLLRFVITLPTASSFPLPLPTQLLSETLNLYATLASYGLYAHIVTTAQEHLMQLSRYVRSPECRSPHLRSAWLNAVEAWIICALDPHCTTPSHEILWSQVVGWGWREDVLSLRPRLYDSDEDTWADLWSAAAAFLEGAKVNCVRGGEEERAAVATAVKGGFAEGTEKRVVLIALRNARDVLGKLSAGMRQAILPSDVPSLRELGRHARALSSAIRLFLSCLPASNELLEEPPFPLPFQELSDLCAAITTHPLWPSLYTPESISYAHIFFRPLSSLLSSYLSLSRRIPGTSPDLWMAQAFAILHRLFPGDDEVARRTTTEVAEMITVGFLQSRGWSVLEQVRERGGVNNIVPFLTHSLSPKADHIVGPRWMTPESIASATTQRLPPLSTLLLNDRRDQPLPLPKDWAFRPLDHLLRSGETEVFKNLPPSWDASEVEVVRATLLFICVSQEVLRHHHLTNFLMSREEASFGCMKVFMLEHGQPSNTSDSSSEVFRDTLVESLMSELLMPFSASASTKTLKTPPPSIHTADSIDVVAKRFLGSGVPFYQWYTDLVALYDAVSFAHPLFARLLLPPLSMRYPVDYRHFLWADHGHVVRTARVAPEDTITGSVAEYLWPVEMDAEVVGAYVRALVSGPLEGFVRLVAVHHVAARIWPDLGSDGEERAQRLLRALVDQGGFEAVRDVVLYWQNREGTIVLPPACFELQGSCRAARLVFVGGCGEDVRERLRSLLEN